MDPKIFSMGVESTLLALAFLPTMGVRAWLPDYPLSGREVQAKGGYYTDSGKYLGGIPKYDDELEQYGCTAYNRNSTCYVAGSNATACLTWTANEIGTDEYEVGTCYCSAITNDEYCSAWACSQTEVSTTPTCSGEGEITGPAGTTRKKRPRGAPAWKNPTRGPTARPGGVWRQRLTVPKSSKSTRASGSRRPKHTARPGRG